jgi:hypothetical protein
MTRSRSHLNWSSAAVVALAGAVLSAGLSGCLRRGEAETEPVAPAAVEQVQGSELSQVTLTEEATHRLGVATAAVREQTGAGARAGKVVPFGAVLYDADGQAWVYTVKAERTYLRAPIVVDRVEGDTAYLRDGPAAGTTVVTVGVPELYGSEYGVEGE